MAQTTWKQAVYDIADAYREAEGITEKISIAQLKEKVRSGSSLKLNNGVEWNYRAESDISPTRTTGARPTTDLLKQTLLCDELIMDLTTNISSARGTVKHISDTEGLALVGTGMDYYISYFTYDSATGSILSKNHTLGRIVTHNSELIWSDIIKETSTIYTAFFQLSYGSTSLAAADFNVNYIRFKLIDGVITILSSGYIPYQTNYNYYPAGCGALYDSSTGTYTLLLTRLNTSSSKSVIMELQEVNKSMALVGSAYGSKTIYDSSYYISGNNSFSKHAQASLKKICGHYVVFMPKINSSDNNLRFFKSKSLVAQKSLGDSTNCDGVADIIELSSTAFLAVTNTGTVHYAHYGTISGTTVTIANTTMSNTFISSNSWSSIKGLQLLKISSSKALIVQFGTISGNYVGMAYAFVTISSSKPTIGTPVRLMYTYNSATNKLFSINKISNTEFSLTFMNGYVNKLLTYFFDINSNTVHYKGYQDSGITGNPMFEFIDDSHFVMATSSQIAIFTEGANGTWTKTSSLTVNISTVHAVKAISNNRILVSGGSTLYLYSVSSTGTITLVSSKSIGATSYGILEELTPNLFIIAMNQDCRLSLLSITDSGTITAGSAMYVPSSTPSVYQVGHYRLTDHKFLFQHQGNPLVIIDFNEDYSTYTVTTRTEWISQLSRVSKKVFYALFNSASSAAGYTFTFDDDMNITSTQHVSINSNSGIGDSGINPSNMQCAAVGPYCSYSLYKYSYSVNYHSALTSFDGSKHKVFRFLGINQYASGYYMASTTNRALLAFTVNNTVVFKVGTVEQMLVAGGNSHLLISDVSNTKYGKAFALGGIDNDSYPN